MSVAKPAAVSFCACTRVSASPCLRVWLSQGWPVCAHMLGSLGPDDGFAALLFEGIFPLSLAFSSDRYAAPVQPPHRPHTGKFCVDRVKCGLRKIHRSPSRRDVSSRPPGGQPGLLARASSERLWPAADARCPLCSRVPGPRPSPSPPALLGKPEEGMSSAEPMERRGPPRQANYLASLCINIP